MISRIVIRNRTGSALQVMVEPLAWQEDVANGESLAITASYVDRDLIIDINGQNAVSMWTPSDASFQKVNRTR